MKINNIDVDVLVNGKPVKLFGHNGKTYIVANYGSEYEIKIRNDNYYRVMAVISVDGLSVLDGKPASKDGSGYVLNAYSSYNIKGFRKDQDTVGAFKFTKKKKGYAKEVTGSAENSGVIAIAVFAEKQPMYWNNSISYGGTSLLIGKSYPTFSEPQYNYYSTTDGRIGSAVGYGSCCGSLTLGTANLSATATVNSSMNCSYTANADTEKPRSGAGGQSLLRSMKQEAPDFNAATTWGKKLEDRVVNTTFEKSSSYPMAEFNIYYDIRQNLEKIGISFEAPKQVAFPKPFPKGFATPPAGWQS